MKKLISILFLLLFLNTVFAIDYCNNDMLCNNLETKYNCPSDCAKFRLGIDEVIYSVNQNYGWPIENTIQKLSEFNAVIHRMRFYKHICLSSSTTINAPVAAQYKIITKSLIDKGIILIGSDNTVGPAIIEGTSDHIAVLRRDLSANSKYRDFLLKHQESWRVFSAYFPEIKYWELGNESNVDVYFHSQNNEIIPFDEKAKIVADMMYHAKKGINQGNPDAFVFTPGIANYRLNEFLEKIYVEIERGTWGTTNPRDFFDGIGWHPYGVPTNSWKQDQIERYNIVKQHDNDKIPVLFSEYGFSDNYDNLSQIPANTTKALNYFTNDMPWLFGVTWFRLYDDPFSNRESIERTFGLIKSPENGEQAKPILNSFLPFANKTNYNIHNYSDSEYLTIIQNNYIPTIPVPADYDGDGKDDKATYYSWNGEWDITYSKGGNLKTNWGGDPTDIPVPADYDGDGKTDLAVYRSSSATWFIISSKTQTADFTGIQMGWSATTPIPADYDGDGKTDLAVYNPTAATWYVNFSSGQKTNWFIEKSAVSSTQCNNNSNCINFGWSATTPVPADYDGDGKTDFATYYPPTANWYIIFSSGQKPAWFEAKTVVSETCNNNENCVQFGWSATTPVPADYDGDGKDDVAVYHPDASNWYVNNSTTGLMTTHQFGAVKLSPFPADYDGDGFADLTTYNFQTNTWNINYSNQPVTPTCTSFTYSTWTPTTCSQTEQQTRTIITRTPTGCINGNPTTTKTCSYIPPTQTNPICNLYHDRYTLEQWNNSINDWRHGDYNLIEIVIQTKIRKYCN